MKILHVTETALGGVGTYLAEILPAQARHLGSGNVRALVPDRHAAHLGGVDRRLLATWRRVDRSILSIWRLGAALRREVREFKPDVIHAHSSIAGLLVRSFYGRLRSRARLVYCPHGWAFDRQSSGGKKKLTEAVERTLSSLVDRIILISEHERHEGLRIGIAPDRMALVLNGIADLPTAQPSHWEDDRLRVLFVGRLDQQKGFDTLLDAVEPIQDRVSLRVIGKAVAGLGRSSRPRRAKAEYLGWRSLAEVSMEIAAADVVVIPSRWEGFGLVALEAMRGSCAVLASAVGGLREIVVPGETGILVPTDNPERLMRALLSHDRAAWRAMGAAGRTRFETAFTASRMNAELLEVYARLPSLSTAARSEIPVGVHA